MPEACFLAFDFGTKRIGVAVGNNTLKTATPLETITYKENEPDWLQIANLIREWRPKALIIGIPLNMDGSEQSITTAARHFMQTLNEKYHLPTFGVDERLTTVEARSQIFEAGGYKALKKSQIDSMAAKLILEDWMRQHDTF